MATEPLVKRRRAKRRTVVAAGATAALVLLEAVDPGTAAALAQAAGRLFGL